MVVIIKSGTSSNKNVYGKQAIAYEQSFLKPKSSAPTNYTPSTNTINYTPANPSSQGYYYELGTDGKPTGKVVTGTQGADVSTMKEVKGGFSNISFAPSPSNNITQQIAQLPTIQERGLVIDKYKTQAYHNPNDPRILNQGVMDNKGLALQKQYEKNLVLQNQLRKGYAYGTPEFSQYAPPYQKRGTLNQQAIIETPRIKLLDSGTSGGKVFVEREQQKVFSEANKINYNLQQKYSQEIQQEYNNKYEYLKSEVEAGRLSSGFANSYLKSYQGELLTKYEQKYKQEFETQIQPRIIQSEKEIKKFGTEQKIDTYAKSLFVAAGVAAGAAATGILAVPAVQAAGGVLATTSVLDLGKRYGKGEADLIDVAGFIAGVLAFGVGAALGGVIYNNAGKIVTRIRQEQINKAIDKSIVVSKVYDKGIAGIIKKLNLKVPENTVIEGQRIVRGGGSTSLIETRIRYPAGTNTKNLPDVRGYFYEIRDSTGRITTRQAIGQVVKIYNNKVFTQEVLRLAGERIIKGVTEGKALVIKGKVNVKELNSFVPTEAYLEVYTGKVLRSVTKGKKTYGTTETEIGKVGKEIIFNKKNTFSKGRIENLLLRDTKGTKLTTKGRTIFKKITSPTEKNVFVIKKNNYFDGVIMKQKPYITKGYGISRQQQIISNIKKNKPSTTIKDLYGTNNKQPFKFKKPKIFTEKPVFIESKYENFLKQHKEIKRVEGRTMGFYDSKTNKIYVRDDLNIPEKYYTIGHELGHAYGVQKGIKGASDPKTMEAIANKYFGGKDQTLILKKRIDTKTLKNTPTTTSYEQITKDFLKTNKQILKPVIKTSINPFSYGIMGGGLFTGQIFKEERKKVFSLPTEQLFKGSLFGNEQIKGLGIGIGTKSWSGQATAQTTKPLSLTKSSYQNPTLISTTFKIPPIFPATFFGSNDKNNLFSNKQRKESKGKSSKYQASVGSVFLGLPTKKVSNKQLFNLNKKVFTGIELRPVISLKGKKSLFK